MAELNHPLLVVSCKVLELAEASPIGPRIFRLLARRTREGAHLLLTASEPDQWFPTRGHEDNVLGRQKRLRERLQEAGGELDGVYYVPRSMFTQDRKRTTALKDILKRYGSAPANATLVSSSKAFLRAAARLEIPTVEISADEVGLERLVAAFGDDGAPAAAAETAQPAGDPA